MCIRHRSCNLGRYAPASANNSSSFYYTQVVSTLMSAFILYWVILHSFCHLLIVSKSTFLKKKKVSEIPSEC